MQMSSTEKGVIVGVDRHKMSVTIDVVDTTNGYSVAAVRHPNAGYAAMQRSVKEWPDRV